MKKIIVSLLLSLLLICGVAYGWSVFTLAGSGVYSWIDEFTDSDGTRLDAHVPTGSPELGMPLTSSTGTITSNTAIHTEALGSDLAINGDFEAGDPPTSWIIGSGTPTLDGVADERTGGAGSQSIEVTRGTDNFCAYSAAGIVTVPGTIYKISGWVKNVDATTGYIVVVGTPVTSTAAVSATSWTYVSTYFFSESLLPKIRLYVTGGAGVQCRFDDVTIEPVTLSSVLSLTDLGFGSGRYWMTPGTTGAKEFSGIVLLADDLSTPVNGVFVLLDLAHNKVIVSERVAGTDNELIAEAVTYVEGAKLDVVFDRSNGKLTAFYNSILIDTSQAVDPALHNNTISGILTTGNAQIDAVNYRSLAYEAVITTSGDDITKANPGVVSAIGHGLSDGDMVQFRGLTEMTEMEGEYDIVANKAANTFEIRDTSGYIAAETTGGDIVRKVQ